MSTQYKAFLLRLHRDEGQSYWQATLENAHTGERIRFANHNEMLRYLLHDLTEPSDRTEQPKPDSQHKGDDPPTPTT